MPRQYPDEVLFAGGADMSAQMRSQDWSGSPLGRPEDWPQSLRSVVGLLLQSQFPMFVAWGPELGLLYNDAYAEILGAKHPAALGARFRDVWSEIWPDVSPLVDAALAGEATFRENLPLAMQRRGYEEQTWFTFSYSPVRDGSGQVAGLFCACTETTAQMLAERQQRFRIELDQALAGFTDPRAVMDAAVTALGRQLGANRVGYGEVLPDGTIRLPCCFADGVEPLFGTLRLDDFGPQSVKRQRDEGRTEVCDDVQADPGQIHATWAAIQTRAFVSVPLVRHGRLTATLYANSRDPRRWTEHEVALIEDVAARTWDAVQRARAQAELRESEARFRNMADHAPVMLWVTDPSGASTYVSRLWQDITGQAETDLLGFRWLGAVHPEDRAEAERQFRKANAARAPFRLEYRLRRADGSYRWAIDAASPRFGPAGEFLGYVGSVIDIDERRETETRLALSEEQLRLATESAEIGLWDVDPVHGTLFWPARVKAMFGISPEVPVTMADFYEGLHPEDRAHTAEAFASAADPDRRAIYDVEYRTIGKEDGVVRWLAAKGRGLFDDEGTCIRVIGTAIDITARKRDDARLRELNESLESRVAERTDELAQSERRFRGIFDTTHQLMSLAALDGTLLVANRAALEAIGATQEQVAGLRMWDAPWWAASPAEARHLREGLARVARGEFVRYEAELVLPAGPRVFDFSMKPVLDDDGTPVFLVAEGRDITEQKQAEAALRQAQKMDAVGQLTGGIAHDFNNLLGAVVGSLDLIRRRPDDAGRVRRYAEAGLEAAERGAKLTGQLLAFSRAQRIELRPLLVAEIVGGMRDLLGSTLGPMVKLDFDLDEDRAPVLGDAVQLEMAVLNLAINARDAMGPAGGRLGIRTVVRRIDRDPELKPGDYVELSVTDTGAGMPPEVLAKAFDPFFTTKGPGKGTGLGLSQVYGIARQAGGTARIESRPGRGTAVRLYLPRTAEVVGRAEGPEAGFDPGPRQPAGTVLVIDDDPDVRRMTVSSLEALGYHPLEAADGPSGLALMDGAAPDALVLDFAMPGMNGAEVARAVWARRPGLPIVFVSGYADTAAIESVAGDKAGVLRKPFRLDDLQQALSAAFGRSRAEPPERAS
jgi:PAS domain S-box-containing protein